MQQDLNRWHRTISLIKSTNSLEAFLGALTSVQANRQLLVTGITSNRSGSNLDLLVSSCACLCGRGEACSKGVVVGVGTQTTRNFIVQCWGGLARSQLPDPPLPAREVVVYHRSHCATQHVAAVEG
jgi:hypothetical protein